MAFEADRVVVSLIADNDQFDANVRSSAATYQQGMDQITTAAGGAEKAHSRMTLATNNNRIAMLEFQHVVRGTAEQLAIGTPPTQILSQHIGQLGQAVTLAGGTFGRFGAFLGGPWGLALTVAVAGVATLIARHHEEGDTVDSLLEKLKKHHDQTLLNQQAEDIWSHSIDGVIDSEKKLADQLDKTLTIQSVAQRQSVTSAQALVATRALQLAKAEDQFNVGDPNLVKAQQAFHEAVRIMQDDLLKFGEQEGQALTDLTKRSQDWADAQTAIIRNLQGVHPELSQFGGDINAAFDALKKSVSDAAGANVPFDSVTHQVDALNNRLAQSPDFIKEYIASLKQLAAQLEATVQTAKNAPKAIEDFKKAVIGAEGTGQNRLGSSAAGFGQFMPSTFESYFKQLFPQQAASMTNAQIDDLRNNKQIAEAVIDAATKDYVSVLQRAGQQITAAALYTVHLLGSGDAARFFAASPGTKTSSFLSAGVLAGNPFLRGTVSQASSNIAQRIGDSSSAVSQGATALQAELNRQLEEEEKHHEHVLDLISKEADVSRDLTDEQYKQKSIFVDIPKDIEAAAAAEAQLKEHIKQVTDEEREAKQIGEQFVENVLDPSHWDNWGDAAKNVLGEIKSLFLQLALINPIENALFGSNKTTLGSFFGGLFGGGGFDSAGFGLTESANATSLGLPPDFFSHRASGGPVQAGQAYMVGEHGPEPFIPSQSGMIIPNNAAAASPWGAAQSMVSVLIEASPYFDGRVMDVTGPVIAQASVTAAQGGSALARQNLARKQLHTLG